MTPRPGQLSARARQDPLDEGILRRICGEFMEMPGLQLTRAQAQRLLGLDEATCSEMLEFLVDARFLYQPRLGVYMRTDDPDASRLRRHIAFARRDLPRRKLKDAS
jgi:hypothetical protein